MAPDDNNPSSSSISGGNLGKDNDNKTRYGPLVGALIQHFEKWYPDVPFAPSKEYEEELENAKRLRGNAGPLQETGDVTKSG